MGSEDGGVFLGGEGGVLSPSNSLLNWALDRGARCLDPEWEEGSSRELVELSQKRGCEAARGRGWHFVA